MTARFYPFSSSRLVSQGSLLALSLALSACNDHAGRIDATAEMTVEIPDSVVEDYPFPLLLTLSMGHQGREEVTGTSSSQLEVVLCDGFTASSYRERLYLSANCKRDDFYVRATLRRVTLDDPDACVDADEDGLLLLSSSEIEAGNRTLAEASDFAWDKKDCGNQFKSFDLVLESID